MVRTRLVCSCFLLLFCVFNSLAQDKKSANLGRAYGIVRDTALNYVLKAATVSIYKVGRQDSILLSYQITNSYGVFNFGNLPVGIPLKVQVNNVGYKAFHKYFTIPYESKLIDLKILALAEKITSLKEVAVMLPPISMNGDTLEFNPRAFVLDSNAVVEDLLRKIPNITVWGDGKITVNGREIKSLLVNGKEFFGGDFKIASQNIPKLAVDKIQVYKQAIDKNNPLDSTLMMNLKLKKGKDQGYFGKTGVGYGSDKRYEADLSINVFTSKLQLSLVAGSNNTNKVATSIGSLLKSSTFKGIGTNVEYQPDFTMAGQNKQRAIGTQFNYNFIENPTLLKKSSLKADYFANDRNVDNSSSFETTTITNKGEIKDRSVNNSTSFGADHLFNTSYEWLKDNNSLTITQALKADKVKSYAEAFSASLNEMNERVSTTTSTNTIAGSNTSFDFSIGYQMNNPFSHSSKNIKNFSARYSVMVNEGNNDRLNIISFKSFKDSSSNLNFNRNYLTRSNGINQELSFSMNNLKEFLFGRIGRIGLLGFDISLNNNIRFSNNKTHDIVNDFDVITLKYEENSYLTNLLRTNIIEELPGLVLTKSIDRQLANRFSKTWYFSASAVQKIIAQESSSVKDFQNIKRSYSRFVPELSVRYVNNQFGDFYRQYTLNFNTTVNIPGIQQLAPLIDSANVYSIQNGNRRLTESVTRTLSFSFTHDDQKSVNAFNYGLNAVAGITDNEIIDSLIIDIDNRRSLFQTNADGSKYLNVGGNIRKAFKLKQSQLQIEFNHLTNISQTPGYMNNSFFLSNRINTSSNILINCTYKDDISFEARQSFSTYSSKQEKFSTSFSGNNIATTLSSNYNITNKLSVNTNIRFNKSSAANADDITFTIWNANISYRLMKERNLEFKFSALDLLHQNTSVINYGNPNSFTTGTQNVLQHYFMVTLLYYPRKFGKMFQKRGQ